MKTLFIFLQTNSKLIEQKIIDAPNKSYSVGILIGSFLPFLFFAIIAYGIYYFNKSKSRP